MWVDELAERAATGWDWAKGAVAYGRALLAEPAAAGALFDEAVAHYEVAHRPYELARTHLAYGELLRRSQRRVDSRTHLRSALTTSKNSVPSPSSTRQRRSYAPPARRPASVTRPL